MFGELEHVAIAAQDTERLANWYMEVLGYELGYRDPKTGTYFIKRGGKSMLEITPANTQLRAKRGMKDPGISHLAIWVDDFDHSHSALAAKGVKFVSEVDEEKGVKKVIFFEDPEGNLLHLMYRPRPVA